MWIAQIVGLRSLMLYKLVEHGSLDARACFCVRTCVPYVRAMQMVSFELCTGDAVSSVGEWILKNVKGDKKEIKLCRAGINTFLTRVVLTRNISGS